MPLSAWRTTSRRRSVARTTPVWANCTGTVYADPIRTENAVHSLEHGAIWITYNPTISSTRTRSTASPHASTASLHADVAVPRPRAAPSLCSRGATSSRSTSADDERIDQFITALRLNPNAYPEVGASCSTNPRRSIPSNPPPFDPTPPGADAVPMDGTGATPATDEQIPAGG